ncbi:MAG: prolipoprotein diacylglyceryl transferase [Betaproteobacteria bacterium RIFCSPLOWO2_12_FULL_65_14]|nr:MAG: prolipoprotein diacylglyceryl transferase [Betaproteobacteria bacterium RIFCSPLOWO2_12_FULL_65_14]
MVWDIDRVIVRIGPVALRWYSLLFALGFLVGYFIVKRIFEKEGRDARIVDSLLVYLVVATIVGARLGQVFFYEPVEYLTHPLEILKVWEGGLASHGGFAAVLIALVLFCRKHRDISFFWLGDRLSIPIMLAAGFIRIGNLFNSEIIGRTTSVAWAVVFEQVDALPRHPTQIYESLGYFAASFILYVWYRARAGKPREGRLLGMAMILGFGWRFVVEFFKENQEAFESALPLNMGQVLSIPFIVIGLFFAFGGQFKVPFLRAGLSTEARAERTEPPT